MSSISIKKSIVKINKIDKISIAPDTLMCLYALESNKKIIKAKEKLTYYMLHSSNSNIVTNYFEEYRNGIITQADLNLNMYKMFDNQFHSRKAINHLNLRKTDMQIQKYLFETNKFPSKLINYIINGSGSLKFRIKIFSACILIKVYPNTRKYISNKMWNSYRKQVKDVI